mmetsp:Transcript_11891/g.27069  ORF Transcript_11891/g.27069 Transcript_11891/m.27069 type:complete len:376 (+) Transcript_11891:1569-2696(+)
MVVELGAQQKLMYGIVNGPCLNVHERSDPTGSSDKSQRVHTQHANEQEIDCNFRPKIALDLIDRLGPQNAAHRSPCFPQVRQGAVAVEWEIVFHKLPPLHRVAVHNICGTVIQQPDPVDLAKEVYALRFQRGLSLYVTVFLVTLFLILGQALRTIFAQKSTLPKKRDERQESSVVRRLRLQNNSHLLQGALIQLDQVSGLLSVVQGGLFVEPHTQEQVLLILRLKHQGVELLILPFRKEIDQHIKSHDLGVPQFFHRAAQLHVFAVDFLVHKSLQQVSDQEVPIGRFESILHDLNFVLEVLDRLLVAGLDFPNLRFQPFDLLDRSLDNVPLEIARECFVAVWLFLLRFAPAILAIEGRPTNNLKMEAIIKLLVFH